MKKWTWALIALIAAGLLSVGPLWAEEKEGEKSESPQPFWEWEKLTDGWFGARDTLADHGVEFEFVYTGDIFGNIRGGISKGATYLDDFDMILSLDMEKLVNWKGASFSFYGLGIHGGSPSNHAGDLQALSNIDGPDVWELLEAWYQQNFLDDRLSFLFGLHDVNSEFDVIETGGLFINSSHGIGPDFSQSGQNGPSIIPATSLAARVRGNPLDYLYIQAAVYDGVPGDPNDAEPEGVEVHFEDGDGVLVVSEVGFLPGELKEDAPYGKVAVGSWIYSAEFSDLKETDAAGNPLQRDGNFGVYALGEYTAFREAEDKDQGLALFARFGFANPHINQLQYYFGSGLAYTGAIPTRDEDKIGIAVAAAFNGQEFYDVQKQAGARVDQAEVDVELSYRAQITPWFALQPDIQWIRNPGTDPALKDAFLLGSRWELSF